MMADQAEALELSIPSESARPVRRGPFANRNFRLLWMGENVSLLGDQFYVVALPWLVFQMTGSKLAFGTILMVEGIPRALLMLFGGVLTDRRSSRTVMTVSNLLRLVFTALLTLVVAGQAVQLWMLYVLAFCFGAVDAFFHPAYMAMVPTLVDDDQLQVGNSLMQGTAQLTGIVGQVGAGVLVYAVGVVFSFAFDALTFLFTSITLLLMRDLPQKAKKASAEAAQKPANMLAEIGEMLAFVRRDSSLATLILVSAAINFFFNGPVIVGTAALSHDRFVEGPVALGSMLAAFGIGALIGMLTTSFIHPKRPALISLFLIAVAGGLLAAIGFASTLIVACALAILMGWGVGFTNVIMITWIQKRIAKEMMGRVMSLIMLASFGLMPISNALSGALADWNLTALFVIAGVMVALTSVFAVTNRELRAIEA